MGTYGYKPVKAPGISGLGQEDTPYPYAPAAAPPNIPNTPYAPSGGFQPPPSALASIAVPQAPQVKVPTLGNILQQSQQYVQGLPQLQSTIPELQQYGQQLQQNYLSGLQDIFMPQREQLAESNAARGLYEQGEGVGGRSMRRLAAEQARVASQGVAGIQTDIFGQIIREKQRIQGLEENRYQVASQLAANLGMSQAEIDSRYGLQTQNLAYQAQEFQKANELESYYKSQGLNLEAKKAEDDRIIRGYQMELEYASIELDRAGFLNQEDKDDFLKASALYENIIKMANTPGISDEDRRDMLNNASIIYNDMKATIDEKKTFATGGNLLTTGTYDSSGLNVGEAKESAQTPPFYNTIGDVTIGSHISAENLLNGGAATNKWFNGFNWGDRRFAHRPQDPPDVYTRIT